jgi:hypothetical protein
MERPTKEVKLPTSGKTADIVTFFTRGERKRIDDVRNKGGIMKYQGGQSVIEGIHPNFLNNQEDEMLSIGVIKIDGVLVSGNRAVLDEMADPDTEVLIAALTDVRYPKVDENGETEEKKG